jgi:hypothetical protein
MSGVKSVVAVATGDRALSAQRDTTGIPPRCVDALSTSLSPKVSVFLGTYRAEQGPGPALSSTKPETVPLNCDDVVIVPVVLTTTTKFACAGTVKE